MSQVNLRLLSPSILHLSLTKQPGELVKGVQSMHQTRNTQRHTQHAVLTWSTYPIKPRGGVIYFCALKASWGENISVHDNACAFIYVCTNCSDTSQCFYCLLSSLCTQQGLFTDQCQRGKSPEVAGRNGAPGMSAQHSYWEQLEPCHCCACFPGHGCGNAKSPLTVWNPTNDIYRWELSADTSVV